MDRSWSSRQEENQSRREARGSIVCRFLGRETGMDGWMEGETPAPSGREAQAGPLASSSFSPSPSSSSFFFRNSHRQQAPSHPFPSHHFNPSIRCSLPPVRFLPPFPSLTHRGRAATATTCTAGFRTWIGVGVGNGGVGLRWQMAPAIGASLFQSGSSGAPSRCSAVAPPLQAPWWAWRAWRGTLMPRGRDGHRPPCR